MGLWGSAPATTQARLYTRLCTWQPRISLCQSGDGRGHKGRRGERPRPQATLPRKHPGSAFPLHLPTEPSPDAKPCNLPVSLRRDTPVAHPVGVP
mmetsp:Transcript_13881/g.32742  ORF Transcript_13881/g.32742 Transcript_13881/m.32742 type:complete len:95 (+) Transcript_13881:549-833(+)